MLIYALCLENFVTFFSIVIKITLININQCYLYSIMCLGCRVFTFHLDDLLGFFFSGLLFNLFCLFVYLGIRSVADLSLDFDLLIDVLAFLIFSCFSFINIWWSTLTLGLLFLLLPSYSYSGVFPSALDSWYFGSMTRQEAIDLLNAENEVGVFLVRNSSSILGDLVLCVR